MARILDSLIPPPPLPPPPPPPPPPPIAKQIHWSVCLCQRAVMSWTAFDNVRFAASFDSLCQILTEEKQK
ncbi:hypothetical protein E2C01_077254 [Portunus trituberculatus]|uniref:Uncharacterized protein n=1 Tax=Portunus trituberculatus TaxID=210409 RepID=A0A5B7IDX5_PORTR|nr:hypothetical protein [Portunus trituberculatus]